MPMLRKARCPACGSARSTPTTSAYIYCDYCGQLMDLDLEKYRSELGPPSEAYAKLEEQLAPKLAAAKAKRDRAQLAGYHRQLQERWVAEKGAMYGPRMKDPAFATAMVEYLTFQRIVSDLSTALAPIAQQLEEANTRIEFAERGGRYLIKGKSLWPVIELQREAARVYRDELVRFPDPVPDPDDAPPAVTEQLSLGIYIAGFLTMCEDATAKELLERAGLQRAYEQVPDPTLHRVFCGHCGAQHDRVSGAKRVLCESCGKHAEVGSTVSCHGCGANVTIGLGQQQAVCGHCSALVRLAPALT